MAASAICLKSAERRGAAAGDTHRAAGDVHHRGGGSPDVGWSVCGAASRLAVHHFQWSGRYGLWAADGHWRATGASCLPGHLSGWRWQPALSHQHPHFIELVTPYEECLPLMPPGQSFDEMIL